MKKDFVEGAKAATPIILGYIPVGIAYGMMAKATGLTFFRALSFSLFVYTGAGQMAAVTMLAQNAAYVTIVFTVFIKFTSYYYEYMYHGKDGENKPTNSFAFIFWDYRRSVCNVNDR